MPAYDVDLSFARAQSLIGGATGGVPYQAATSSTAFITIGTNGFVLTSNGTTATWTAASGITAGNATNAANVATIAQIASGNYYPTFVDSNNATSANELVYTTGTIIVNPGTGSLAIGSTPVATARLTINQTYATATAAESFPFYITGNYNIADTNLKQVIRTNYGGNHTSGVQAFAINILALHSVGGVGGTTTNAYNYWSRMDNSTGATVTNAFNFYADNGGGSGGPTNLYGLYIATLNKGTNNYAVYTSGSTPSFFGGAVTVAGNLTVQGTTTIVDSTVTNVADPIITLGGGANNAAPTADDNKDRGIAFKWHNGTVAKNGFFGYDDSTGFLTFVPDATITNEVVSGTKGAIDANLAGGSAMSMVYQSAANTTAFLSAGTAGYVLQTNGTGSAPTWVAASGLSAASASQVNTVLQTSNAAYYATFVDANNASATAESVYTTSTFSVNPATGVITLGSATVNGTVTATSIVITGSGGDITGANNITATGLITGGSFLATATTVSSSTSTGALQVRGGAGIAGNLYVGGTVFGTVNSATNLSAGTAGQVPYQTGPGATSFYGPGTAGQLLVSNGAAAPVYTNTGSIFVGRATTATTLASGSAMALAYQSAANTTAFLSAGTAGQILQTNGTGSAPTWVPVSGTTVGTSTQVQTVLRTTNATHYLTFVDSNNASATAEAVYTTSSFYINPGTGSIGITNTVTSAGFFAASGFTQKPVGNYDIATSNYIHAGTGINIGVAGGGGLTFGNGFTPSTISGTPSTIYAYVNNNSAGNQLWYGNSTGLIVGNGSSPTAKLDVQGNAKVTGNFTVTINASILGSAVVGTTSTTNKFEVAGTAGQLFSVSDSFTGTIFAASDISGIPSIEVLDTGLVKLAQYNGSVSIGTPISISRVDILGTGATTPALTIHASEEYNVSPTNYFQWRYKYNAAATYITGSSIIVKKSNAVDGDTQSRFSIFNRTNGGSQTERFYIDGSTSTISGGLQVGSITWPAGTADGEIRASNEITAYYSSDARLKENVKLIEDPITLIEQIRGVYFDWTDEHIAQRGGEDGYFVRKHDVGVIAQEVQAILPEVVAQRADGFLAVKYEKMIPLLIEAIKAQQKQINRLESEIEAIKNLINK
jgi:hypothetical protein